MYYRIFYVAYVCIIFYIIILCIIIFHNSSIEGALHLFANLRAYDHKLMDPLFSTIGHPDFFVLVHFALCFVGICDKTGLTKTVTVLQHRFCKACFVTNSH